MPYLLLQTDPFYRGKAVATELTLKRERLAHIKSSPNLAEPMLSFVWTSVYRTYWAIFMAFVWTGYAVGDYLSEMAN